MTSLERGQHAGPEGSAAGTAVLFVSLALATAWPSATQAQQSPGDGTIAPIEVTSDRARVRILADRKVYDVGADLQSTTGSAADVLGNIPSVEVDSEGVVALRGDTNVLILIDGRPSSRLTGPQAGVSLQQIPAQQIERIEILTEPPAEFKSQGASGVISIILRKYRREGFAGQANASLGDDRRYVIGTRIDYGSGPLHLAGGVVLRQDERLRVITSDPSVPGAAVGTIVQSENDLDETVRRRVPIVNLGLNFEFNERQSLEVAANRGGRTGERGFLETSESTLVPGGVQSISDRLSVGQEWSMDADRRLIFMQKLDQPGETLEATLHRSSFHEREHYDYTNTYAFPIASPSYDDLDLSEDQASNEIALDFTLPLPGGRRLKAGYDFEGNNDSYGNSAGNIDPATGDVVVNAAATNDFHYLQRVDALYGSYQATGDAWNWTAGLRIERTHTDVRQLTSDIAAQRSYVQAFPSLRVEREVDEAVSVFVAASRRVTRPDASYLNPYVDRQDTQNLRAGNPDLLPQDTQLFEIGYAVDAKPLNYSLTSYLRRNRNSVTDVTEPVAPDVVLTTKENLPRSEFAGLEFVGVGQLNRRLAFGVSGDFFYSQIDASGLGYAGLKSTVGLNAKAHVDAHLSPNDLFQVAVLRSDKRLTPQGEVAAINLVNVGYRRQIRADLVAVATVSDLCNGQTYRRTIAAPDLSDTYQRHVGGRIGYVGLVYSFGAGHKPDRGSTFDYDQ